MSLITLFSAPKAFTDSSIALMQRNAIRSWTLLKDVDVLLLGEEDGLAEASRELGARHIASVAFNANHVPLVSSMLQLARENSDSPLLCIINTDIILMSDFVAAAQNAATLASGQLRRGYVLLSRRWDLEVNLPLDFAQGWEAHLGEEARRAGRLHRPTGSDFFLFPRDCYTDVPDFAIGRAGWDNWMIYKARQQGWPVIDGTPSMTIIHQNHDYRHLPGARPHYDHPDTRVNTQLAGGEAATRYTVLDSTHMLVEGRLERPGFTSAHLLRRVELLLRRVLFFLPETTLESLVRPQRWRKRFARLLHRAS